MPNLDQYRHAVARHLGAVLTPAVATAIEGEAFAEQDHSIDPAQFVRMTHQGYEFRAERMRDIVPELHLLHLMQWQETEAHRHAIEFRPDYERALAHERAGTLLQFTVRQDSALVGHMRLYLNRSTHTSTLFAQEDTIFVRPEHRGGMVGLSFLKYIEAALASIDVLEIRFDTKDTNQASALLRRLKYTPVATRWFKIIKGESHVR